MVDSWLFMQSPLPVVVILVLYLWFVLSLGPNYMKNRKPFELKSALIIYNLYQVLFSIWLCSHALNVKNAIPHFLKHTCRNPSPNKEFQALVLYAHHGQPINHEIIIYCSSPEELGGTFSRKSPNF